MEYPIAIERGDDKHAYGVVVPDFEGCFSAGDSFGEAMANAREAIEMHIEDLLDAGKTLPAPSSIDDLVNRPEFVGWVLALVNIPAEALDATVERVNVSIPKRVLYSIDTVAQRLGKTRSGFLAEAALSQARALEEKKTAA